jgi:exopolysaccharide biosynthesis polyprenyl glycosylphosphotransferase
MSFRAVTPQLLSAGAPVRRMIPGMSAARSGPPKKRAVSIRRELDPKASWGRDGTRAVSRQSAVITLAEIALPTASASGDRLRLASEIAYDFLTIAGGMFMVHVFVVAAQGSLDSVASIIKSVCLDLVLNDFGIILLYGSLVTLLCYSEGLFQSTTQLKGREELKVLCRSVAWATCLLTAAICLSGGGTVTPEMLLATAILATTGMYARRVCQRGAKDQGTAHGKAKRNVLIVGTGGPAHEIAAHINNNPQLGRCVCGFLNERGRGVGGVLGPISDIARIARAQFIDEVIVTISHDKELARTAIAEALRNHLDVRIVPDLLGFSPRRAAVECLGNIATIPLHEERIPQFGLLLKRLLDLVIAAVMLLATAPLMAVIALAIKVDSAGPVLYRALRVGKKGRHFLCYKFRTMRTDADLLKESLRERNEREGPIFKIASDPRITNVGKFLRRYSLDELPQLWNVWNGEMSLVGPRPHPVDDYQRYELQHLSRLDVTPGITGLWQVMARHNPSFHLNMALDLEYIEGWTLSRDFQILWRTVGAVFSGSGA